LSLRENSTDIILVVSGALFGANARFFIYTKLEKIKVNKNYIIMIINTFSSFCLGLFLSFLSHNSPVLYSYQLGLFFSIGLLGSLSTFSTFIYDLYALLIKFKFYRAFKLFIISLIAGILSFTLGFLFGIP
tara:strand:+ start:16 stop:408 length:393 start_codon:yes stop_codon:yes gene_type:complete